MKRLTFVELVLLFLIAPLTLLAQWQPQSAAYVGDLYHLNGNVGIGVNQPAELLHVKSVLPYPRISVQSTHASGAPGFGIRDAAGNPRFTWHYDIGGGFMGFFQEGSGNRLVIKNDGNVGIGTIDPKGYKLAVAGKAIAEEIVVKLQANWPDYVFEKNYDLLTLTEVENYINQNKHLPEVPAAQDMAANGVNVGEMNLLLLKKVEELTLYVIELKKEIDTLKKN